MSTDQHLRPLRICIDARWNPHYTGGAGLVPVGLASGFSQLADGDEEFYFLAYPGKDEHLRPCLRNRCRILYCSEPVGPPPESLWKRAARRVPGLQRAWRASRRWRSVPSVPYVPADVPYSDGTVESAGMDLIHFPQQDGFLTALPSIYQPHDLQHLHFPEFFTAAEYAQREKTYRTCCAQSSMIAMMTHWGKRDLVQHYGIVEDKVCVVPGAPMISIYPSPLTEDLDVARQRFALPNRFAFFPAQTWAHKNHMGLLDALALLRNRDGLRVPLVCTGFQNSFFSRIREHVAKLGLDSQVQFLGFITPLELHCLYSLCSCLVFPSLFEGWGLPISEAFVAGTPVACSSLDPLVEQAGDAALFFDPHDAAQIADAIRRLWLDILLRDTLVARGKRRAPNFTWERAARIFRSHYRRLTNRPLSEEDHLLIPHMLHLPQNRRSIADPPLSPQRDGLP